MSPARYIRQSSVENKITCPNYNNISEQLNGLSWKTVRWVSDRVAVLDKKGKLSRFTRMVLGWVIILEFKRIKFKKKMNKRNCCCYISVLSAVNGCNNVTCKNTIFIRVAVGRDGFVICTQKKMNKMDLTLNIIVLSGNNIRNNVMCSNMIFIKVAVGWDGFLICIKKNFKNE